MLLACFSCHVSHVFGKPCRDWVLCPLSYLELVIKVLTLVMICENVKFLNIIVMLYMKVEHCSCRRN